MRAQSVLGKKEGGKSNTKRKNKTKAYPLNFLEYEGRIGLKIIRKVRERVT